MSAQTLTVYEWIDRCTMRLGQLLPAMEPSEVARRAAELKDDAYEHSPEDAAEIYALEMPPVEAGSICDYKTAPRSAWVLAFKNDELTSKQRTCAATAAQAVLEGAGVSAFEVASTQFRLESWDMAGFDDELALTPDEDRAYRALREAGNAADRTVYPDEPYRHAGWLVARWPSKVRFEAARERWLQRQAKDN